MQYQQLQHAPLIGEIKGLERRSLESRGMYVVFNHNKQGENDNSRNTSFIDLRNRYYTQSHSNINQCNHINLRQTVSIHEFFRKEIITDIIGFQF